MDEKHQQLENSLKNVHIHSELCQHGHDHEYRHKSEHVHSENCQHGHDDVPMISTELLQQYFLQQQKQRNHPHSHQHSGCCSHDHGHGEHDHNDFGGHHQYVEKVNKFLDKSKFQVPDQLTIDEIHYTQYRDETQMPLIMNLITKDLSEPYSIYTYRYFIYNWPFLCFLVKD